MNDKITVAIADDHHLFLSSISLMINTFPSFSVVCEAGNGNKLIEDITRIEGEVDLVLLDVKMPGKNGIITAKEISSKYPAIKIVALSMNNDDASILQMVRSGACAFLLKEMHPTDFEKALLEIYHKGYYNSDAVNVNYRRLLTAESTDVKLTIQERKFLDLAAKDLTYKQIASQMNLSEKTIDGYRDSLFQKLGVQSRVGMVMQGLRQKLIEL